MTKRPYVVIVMLVTFLIAVTNRMYFVVVKKKEVNLVKNGFMNDEHHE